MSYQSIQKKAITKATNSLFIDAFDGFWSEKTRQRLDALTFNERRLVFIRVGIKFAFQIACLSFEEAFTTLSNHSKVAARIAAVIILGIAIVEMIWVFGGFR